MLYYGTEAGMWSPDDPSNRMPMVWEGMNFDDPQVKFDAETFNFVQRAIATRNKLEPLKLGFFHGTVIDDANSVYAYQRDLADKHAYVVINRSAEPRTIKVPVSDAVGAKLVNWLDADQARIVTSENERPTLEPTGHTAVTNGSISVKLKPFESAILSTP